MLIDFSLPPAGWPIAAEVIKQIAIDAFRDLRIVERNVIARPDRAIRDNAAFTELRQEAWMEFLAVQMAFFASSDDVCADVWPYTRFEDKLRSQGLSLPVGMDIATAVYKVETAIAEGNPKWYARNIASPMGVRAATVGAVQPPRGEDADDRDPFAYLEPSIRTWHGDQEIYSILLADLQRGSEQLRSALSDPSISADDRDLAAAGALVFDSIIEQLATVEPTSQEQSADGDSLSTEHNADEVVASELLPTAIEAASIGPKRSRTSSGLSIGQQAARAVNRSDDDFLRALEHLVMDQIILDGRVRPPESEVPRLSFRGSAPTIDPAWMSFYRVVRKQLNQRNHASGECPMSKPWLLNGEGECADCDSDFTYVVGWFDVRGARTNRQGA